MNSEKKWPFIQWFVSDWLGDPKVSLCEPSTRGILFDWLCNMHALDRSGVITGSRDLLARLGRCSAVQCEAALQDLKRTNAADVTERNGVVTVLNRRMKRECSLRKNGSERQQRRRGNGAVTPPVTPHNQNHISEPEAITQKSEDQRLEDYSTLKGEGGAGEGCRANGAEVPNSKFQIPNVVEGGQTEALNSQHKSHSIGLISFRDIGVMAGEIMGNDWGWCYDNCRVKITDFTLAGLQTVLRPFVGRTTCLMARQCWLEAVRQAHGMCVDFGNTRVGGRGSGVDGRGGFEPVKSAAGLCTGKFRELMENGIHRRDAETQRRAE